MIQSGSVSVSLFLIVFKLNSYLMMFQQHSVVRIISHVFVVTNWLHFESGFVTLKCVNWNLKKNPPIIPSCEIAWPLHVVSNLQLPFQIKPQNWKMCSSQNRSQLFEIKPADAVAKLAKVNRSTRRRKIIMLIDPHNCVIPHYLSHLRRPPSGSGFLGHNQPRTSKRFMTGWAGEHGK